MIAPQITTGSPHSSAVPMAPRFPVVCFQWPHTGCVGCVADVTSRPTSKQMALDLDDDIVHLSLQVPDDGFGDNAGDNGR